MDCGGGYAKLLPPGIDTAQFNGDTEYSIMFGPDICGYSTKKVQAIFNYNGENLARNSDVKCPDDEYTHSYVLIVNKDSTYEIRVDGEEKAKGAMKDDWSFEKPKEIKDPDQSKPEDWVDAEKIDDPEDVKPEDWDDEPASIPDPDATKPDDWDDEEDGEWQAPMIDNPEYKGVWRAKRIDNPEYKGKWEHPMIANPDYVEAQDVYKRGAVGYMASRFGRSSRARCSAISFSPTLWPRPRRFWRSARPTRTTRRRPRRRTMRPRRRRRPKKRTPKRRMRRSRMPRRRTRTSCNL